ncbi:MAG: hypothetical protein AAF414_09240 [Pseudomonadota bacterium]
MNSVGTAAPPDLALQSRDSLLAMREAANEVLTCQHVLAKTGHTIVTELTGGKSQQLDDWVHYPAGDVYDAETNAQYYFHQHPDEERGPDEVGHLHIFVRCEAVPSTAQPALAVGDGLCHLIAIAVDAVGSPIRLFTTNRWVTGETWFTASVVAGLLDNFVVGHAQPSWPVNRWVTALIRLFRPEVAWLLTRRDQSLSAQRGQSTEIEALEDRSMEVLSALDIDIADRLDALDAALRRQRRAASAPSPVSPAAPG